MYNHYLEDYQNVGLTSTRLLMNAYILLFIHIGDDKKNYLEKMMILGIALQNALPYPIVIRIFEFLVITSILAIPNLIKEKKSSVFLVFTIIYGFIKFGYFLYNNVSGVVPYEFFGN